MSRARSALVLGVVLASACAPSIPPPVALPAAARLQDPDSTAFVVAERYRGKVVVLDFWASWCAECTRTIPQIGRLAAAFAGQGLIVVGVNVGESASAALAQARALGIEYPIALDPELVFSDQLGAGRIPLLLVIDRSGRIARRVRAVDPETLTLIRRLLGVGTSAPPATSPEKPAGPGRVSLLR
ncbi:MAG: TlpA family protein disulfide reductase [Myxococcales bacterium]|nr:TlpA family protein disulfide reductase [Myxococcales bacterium]